MQYKRERSCYKTRTQLFCVLRSTGVHRVNLEHSLSALGRIVDDAVFTDAPTWVRNASSRVHRRRVVAQFRDAQLLQTWPKSGAPRAALALSWHQQSAFGTPVGRLFVLASPDDRPALTALEDMLRALPRAHDWPILVEPHWSLRALTPALMDLGFGIDGLSLVGDIDATCARLVLSPKPRSAHTVLRASAADIDDLLALRHTCYQVEENDQAWFVGTPFELARKRDLLARASTSAWIIRDAYGVAASLTATPNRLSTLVDHIVSVDVAVRRDRRGEGCVRALLHQALPSLQRHGIRFYSGVSARPAILHVAQTMGRVPVRIMMRTGAPHTPAHFASTYAFSSDTVGVVGTDEAAVLRR